MKLDPSVEGAAAPHVMRSAPAKALMHRWKQPSEGLAPGTCNSLLKQAGLK